MKWWHWALILGGAGLVVWYFWPKNGSQPADSRNTVLGAAQQIAGAVGGAFGGISGTASAKGFM